MSYTTQATLDAAIQDGKPVKASNHRAIVANIEAVARKEAGAPIVPVPVRLYFTSPVGSAITWTIPDGVQMFRATVIGGGGGFSNGGSSVVTYNGAQVTAPGGGLSNVPDNGANVATGGDLNLPGMAGLHDSGGNTLYGYGGIRTDTIAIGYGSGGGRVNARGGGAGAYAEKLFTFDPADTTVSIVIGAGGDANGNAEEEGRDGLVIIEY